MVQRSSRGQPPPAAAGADGIDGYRDAVNGYLSSVWGDASPLSKAVFGILEAGGKRLRPAIALLTCEAASGDYRKALPVAAAFELAHSASLVQDDIIDESAMRHGQVTAHKKYGETKAILVSDSMIFRIFLELAKYGENGLTGKRLAKLASLIGNAARLTAEGEYFETVLAEKGDPSEDDYVRLAELKTGALFAASAACGAVVGGGSTKQVEAAYEFGRALGVSFQVRDDILDIVSSEESTGKPLLKDLQNNAMNVILIHALANADLYQKQAINSMLYKRWYANPEIQTLMRTLDQLGSLDYASAIEERYAAKAKGALRAFPASKAKATLERLTERLKARTK